MTSPTTNKLRFGFDVNQNFEENENKTALIEAAQVGNINTAKKQVESGADVNEANRPHQYLNATQNSRSTY